MKLAKSYRRQACDHLVRIYIQKMCCLLLLLLLPIVTSELCEYPWYQYDACRNNSLSCPSDQKCAFIEYCPAVVSLMDRNALSAHRLRQAVCGYDRTRIKVCCSVDSYTERPVDPDRNLDTYPTQLSSDFQCGKSIVRNNVDTLGSHPFVARIGFISKYFARIRKYLYYREVAIYRMSQKSLVSKL